MTDRTESFCDDDIPQTPLFTNDGERSGETLVSDDELPLDSERSEIYGFGNEIFKGLRTLTSVDLKKSNFFSDAELFENVLYCLQSDDTTKLKLADEQGEDISELPSPEVIEIEQLKMGELIDVTIWRGNGEIYAIELHNYCMVERYDIFIGPTDEKHTSVSAFIKNAKGVSEVVRLELFRPEIFISQYITNALKAVSDFGMDNVHDELRESPHCTKTTIAIEIPADENTDWESTEYKAIVSAYSDTTGILDACDAQSPDFEKLLSDFAIFYKSP